MEMLELYHRGDLLARYELGGRAIEIGRVEGCDIVLADPDVADRHWLVMRKHGTVVIFDVSGGKRQRALEHPLPLDRAIPLGRSYEVKRVAVPTTVAPPARVGQEPGTEALSTLRLPVARFVILIGRGTDARRVRVGEGPIHVGRAQDNDIVLGDRAVSEHHLRLEPCEAGLVLRDMGSRNGSFLNGVRVHTAVVGEGAQIRVGRTDLRVSADVGSDGSEPTMVAESSSMLQVLGDVRRVASLPWPVLIVGESGTGKEGIAQSLHELGARRSQRFVAVNAGGLPRELVESELFGHEKGAFTGAQGTHKGVFEQAHGGTLFLDEIGELPLALQARLLRVLETGEVRRVGGESAIRVEVRLLCATHRDLRAMVQDGTFRQDLYYRIARLVIEVPSLRSRPEDVRALCQHFLRQICLELGPRELSEDAQSRLVAYDWPGNARELRNVLCAAAATAGQRIESQDVEVALAKVGGPLSGRHISLETLQRAVADNHGNLSAAARALGIARSTLRDRLKSAA
ncbi:MAG TPA: sigma 54-interacting transcriptional regulator [Polyangiales bacterium]